MQRALVTSRWVCYICCLFWIGLHSSIVFSTVKERIVSLSPSITEIIFALNAEDMLVGNTFYCDYPKEAKSIYKIGSFIRPSLERIIRQKPTLIIGDSLHADVLARLQKSRFQTLSLPIKNFENLISSIEILGRKTNKISESEKIIHHIHESLSQNNKDNKFKNKKTFVSLISDHPMVSFTSKTWPGSVFDNAGWANLVTGSIDYPVLSKEFFFQLKNSPDFIFIDHLPAYQTKVLKNKIKKIFEQSQKKVPKILVLPQDSFVRPSPRVIHAFQFLSQLENAK